MKVYGELTVTGDAKVLDQFICTLSQNLRNGWSRNRGREQEVSAAALGPMHCFACSETASRPASELWMATHSKGHLYVSNIIARQLSSLPYDQYNAILRDFFNNCVLPAAEAAGATARLSRFEARLEDYMSSQTADRLRSFSARANRSILHPLDRERWNEFLAAAYREGVQISADLLQRWLIEEEKWPEDQAISLAVEYEHARDLLRVYEARPA